MSALDVLVVGSGPNGLAAAVTLAHAGRTVEVWEGADTVGGGCRSGDATLPGFVHDHCSSVHPLLAVSPFFAGVGLSARGVVLAQPEVPFAHPLDDGRAAAAFRSLDRTAEELGRDGVPYRQLLEPVVDHLGAVGAFVLSGLRTFPERPLAVAAFGAHGVLPVTVLAGRFAGDQGAALLAGAGAHSMRPLGALLTGSFALLLTGLAHGVGWPVVVGGTQKVTDALAVELAEHGGRIRTGRWVTSLADLPAARAVILDVTPRQLVQLSGPALPEARRRAYRRYRYGPGVCKVDWALAGPVPWTADVCRRAGTVHVGGTAAEVVTAEAEVAAGRHPRRPFCLVVQAGTADSTRAPAGHQALWGYCHVPNGSTVDMTARIETQIERFAPGFRDLILARRTTTAAELAAHDPSFVGGDIGAGAATLRQTLARPIARVDPYATGIEGVWLCSGATPPGPGVHGMCGYHAAVRVGRALGS